MSAVGTGATHDALTVWNSGTSVQPRWLHKTGGTSVYLADYLERVGNDIQQALALALTENPQAEIFDFPTGTFEINAHDNGWIGLRSNMWLRGHNTTLRVDMGAHPGGIYVLAWVDTAAPYENVRITGLRVISYNQPPTTFGAQVIGYLITNVYIEDCYFECEAFSTFGTKMSCGFPAARGIIVTNCVFRRAQLALPQSHDVSIHHNTFFDGNDFGVSVVGVATADVRRVNISHNVFNGIAGTGAIFVGSDGASVPTTLDLLEDVIISNNVFGGDWGGYFANTPNAIVVDSALTTRRIKITNNSIGRNDNNAVPGGGIRLMASPIEGIATDVDISNNTIGRLGDNGEHQFFAIFSQWKIDRLKISNNVISDNRGIEIADCCYVQINDNVVDMGTSASGSPFRMRAGVRDIHDVYIHHNHFQPRGPGFPIGFILDGPHNISATFESNTIYEGSASLPAGGTFQLRMVNNDFKNGLDPTTAGFVIYADGNVNYPL